MGIGSFLFGKSPTTGKAGPFESNLRQGAGYGLGNVMGAKYIGDKKGVPQYDYSQTNKAINMPDAIKDYDFSGFDEASTGLKNTVAKAQSFTPQKLNPYQFNYADPSLLNTFVANQYSLGSRDINREGAGQLTKLRESIGVRRPGLLMKAGQNAQRNTAEQLARLNMTLRGDALGKQVDLTRAQQEAQADELARAAQFNNETEGNNLNSLLNAYKSLGDLAQGKISTQAGITEAERGYQGSNLDRLLALYNNIHGLRKSNPQGGKSGFLGNLVGGGAQVASAFAGKKG